MNITNLGNNQLNTIIPPQTGYKDIIRQKLNQSLSIHGEKWQNILKELQVDNLTNYELAEVYLALAEKGSHARLLFEIQDFIYRRAHTQETSANELQSALVGTPFGDAVNKTATDPKKLLPLVKTNQVAEDVFANMHYGDLPDKIEEREPLYKRVLHAATEYTGAKVGGVGSFTEQLLRVQNELGQDARIITPFYDTYISDFPQAKFTGLVEHYYKGEFVTSSIYEVKTQNGKVKQYLIKPDPKFATLNDIGIRTDVYKSFDESSDIDRFVFYFTSATTAFASSYVGGKHLRPFQVCHTHGASLYHTGELLHKQYGPMREQKGLNRLAHVNHVHGARYYEQGRNMSLEFFPKFGLKKPDDERSDFNLLGRGYTYSDVDIHVSTNYLNMLSTRKNGYGLDAFVNTKRNQGRMVAIQNGIDYERFSPLNRANLGDFAFAQSFDVNGNDITDYLNQREHVKQALYEKGVIADPKKPLFLFVGRFSNDKGIDTLQPMFDEILRRGGQCVIMGAHAADAWGSSLIEGYKRRLVNTAGIKIYDNLETDQKAALEGTHIPKGNLIRLASDFFLTPSHTEPGGLVVKEGWANGSINITTNVEGIADNGKGLGKLFQGQLVGKDTFNAFTFEDNGRFKSNAKQAVTEAMDYWNNTSVEEKNRTVGRILTEAKSHDWKSPEGALEAINTVYDKAVEPKNPNHLKEMEEVERVYNFNNRSILKKIGSVFVKAISGLAYALKTLLLIPVYPFYLIGKRVFKKNNNKGLSND